MARELAVMAAGSYSSRLRRWTGTVDRIIERWNGVSFRYRRRPVIEPAALASCIRGPVSRVPRAIRRQPSSWIGTSPKLTMPTPRCAALLLAICEGRSTGCPPHRSDHLPVRWGRSPSRVGSCTTRSPPHSPQCSAGFSPSGSGDLEYTKPISGAARGSQDPTSGSHRPHTSTVST